MPVCPACGAYAPETVNVCSGCGELLPPMNQRKEKISAWVDSYYLEVLRQSETNVSEVIREALKGAAGRILRRENLGSQKNPRSRSN